MTGNYLSGALGERHQAYFVNESMETKTNLDFLGIFLEVLLIVILFSCNLPAIQVNLELVTIVCHGDMIPVLRSDLLLGHCSSVLLATHIQSGGYIHVLNTHPETVSAERGLLADDASVGVGCHGVNPGFHSELVTRKVEMIFRRQLYTRWARKHKGTTTLLHINQPRASSIVCAHGDSTRILGVLFTISPYWHSLVQHVELSQALNHGHV
mmetsp:Transcript_7006/g.9474  ORF Transcript_7006/g.9474 Transcript_7006/m.9474 type:complete len:211 (-) Transcript_7006:2900-3532(-)